MLENFPTLEWPFWGGGVGVKKETAIGHFAWQRWEWTLSLTGMWKAIFKIHFWAWKNSRGVHKRSPLWNQFSNSGKLTLTMALTSIDPSGKLVLNPLEKQFYLVPGSLEKCFWQNLQVTNVQFFKHSGASNQKGLFFKPLCNPTCLKNKTRKKRTNYQVQLYSSFSEDCNRVAVLVSVFRLFHILAHVCF